MILIALFACGDEPAEPQAGATWDDVSRVVADRCAACHQAGGPGGMDFTDPKIAAEWASAMADATSDRRMPPWLAVADGSCGEFAAPEALTDDEIAVFAAWADAGAPVDGAKRIAAPPVASLDTHDLALSTPEDTPEVEGTVFAQNDEYRCYQFDNDRDEDWFFTGSEVLPGTPSIVHHVLLMVVDPEAQGWGGRTNGEEIADLDDDDTRPGWDCLGTVGGAARERGMPVEWAPGQGAVELPEGLGVRVRPQDVLVAQVHYSMPSIDLRGLSDSTTIRLKTADEVEKEAFFAVPDKFIETMYNFDPDLLPEGRESVAYTWDMRADELRFYAYQDGQPAAYDLWAVLPHMHKYGTSISLRLDPEQGKKECLVDIPRWDFNWQRMYPYAAPVRLEADDVLTVRCEYDTSDVSEPITPGWGTGTEMCLMGMLVTVAD